MEERAREIANECLSNETFFALVKELRKIEQERKERRWNELCNQIKTAAKAIVEEFPEQDFNVGVDWDDYHFSHIDLLDYLAADCISIYTYVEKRQ